MLDRGWFACIVKVVSQRALECLLDVAKVGGHLGQPNGNRPLFG